MAKTIEQNNDLVVQKLKIVGEQIKLARLRRRLSTSFVCNAANISRSTLWQIEKGSPNVAIGSYVQVLIVLGGLDDDITLLAKEDTFGRKLQDDLLIGKKHENNN